MAEGPETRLRLRENLGLDDYQPLHAARADLLRRAARRNEAAAAEETIRTHGVIELTAHDAEIFFAALENPPPLNARLVAAPDLDRAG